jgi:putative two-component system response regulator
MATVLVIDDEELIRDVIVEILEDAGHDVVGVGTAEEGLERLEEGELDLVVSDVVMPGLSGLELLDEVRRLRPSLPVVLVTGAGTQATVSDALAGGADGLVMKPFSHAELKRAAATALDRATRSAGEVRDRLLAPAIAGALANAIEVREASMQGHCERLAELAMRIGAELGLTEAALDVLRLGAVLHDAGKIGIPDRVLLNSGTLTLEERSLMRTHPLIGDHLLAPIDALADVRPIVRHHHERWDGSGYPDGLAAEQIPLAARIVALADSVEAMSGPRNYRAPLDAGRIAQELCSGRGTQWDPALVDVVLRMIDADELTFGHKGLRLSERPDNSPAVSVLLVEGDADEARLAREALERELGDVSVTVAHDLASAERLCRGSTWSLVLLDAKLPDGDGIELIDAVRASAPSVPIVMLADAGPQGVEAFRRGASDYVVKSKRYHDELGARVRMLLERA